MGLVSRITAADLPEGVRNHARVAGAGGWLAQLPDLVVDLERDWSMTVGRVLPDGNEALVAEATLEDGTAAVVKVLLPANGREASHEIAALRLAGGDGCALLLRDDASRNAMLLERLGDPLGTSSLTAAEQRGVLCEAAMRFWRLAPAGDFPTGADKGRWLVDFIRTTWTELGEPCSAAAVGHAIRCAERRIAAHDGQRAVLVHGDIHEWNALAAASGYKLIDPDGLFAEAEYDLGVIMRRDRVDEARASARWLADRTGLNETAILEWATVERLSTALHCTRIDVQPMGRQLLQEAEIAAQAGA